MKKKKTSLSMKQKYFRALCYLLECGHQQEQVTGFYRISRARGACMIGDAGRGGIWCGVCKAKCMPVKYLGTTKVPPLDDGKSRTIRSAMV